MAAQPVCRLRYAEWLFHQAAMAVGFAIRVDGGMSISRNPRFRRHCSCAAAISGMASDSDSVAVPGMQTIGKGAAAGRLALSAAA